MAATDFNALKDSSTNCARSCPAAPGKTPWLSAEGHSRDQHSVPATAISEPAKKGVASPQQSGYEAYLVGAALRDILLSGQTQRFRYLRPIATALRSARTFGTSRLIRRRFRIVARVFGRRGHRGDNLSAAIANSRR